MLFIPKAGPKARSPGLKFEVYFQKAGLRFFVFVGTTSILRPALPVLRVRIPVLRAGLSLNRLFVGTGNC